MDTRDSTLSLMTSSSVDSRDVDLSSISTSSSSESCLSCSQQFVPYHGILILLVPLSVTISKYITRLKIPHKRTKPVPSLAPSLISIYRTREHLTCFNPVDHGPLDRSDRKISAHATLETPRTRTAFIPEAKGNRTPAAAAIPEHSPAPSPTPRPVTEGSSSAKPQTPVHNPPQREKSDLDVKRRNKGENKEKRRTLSE